MTRNFDVLKMTIHLDPALYELDNGRVILVDYEADEYGYAVRFIRKPTQYAVGAEAVLASRTDVSDSAIRGGRAVAQYYLHFDLDGVPSNINPSIKRRHGWRGTTGDVSIDAHGLVRIVKIRALKDGSIAVTVESAEEQGESK